MDFPVRNAQAACQNACVRAVWKSRAASTIVTWLSESIGFPPFQYEFFYRVHVDDPGPAHLRNRFAPIVPGIDMAVQKVARAVQVDQQIKTAKATMRPVLQIV